MSTSAITPASFVAKWKRVKLTERQASQEHFIDLCRLLGQPTPAEHDATGAEYAFEKGINLTTPGQKAEHGFADVWWNGKFGWEYKRKDKYKSLAEAYTQLQRYREALNNPPLLIVSDITTTEIHTNFTNAVNRTFTITLDQIEQGSGLDLLRRAFTDPESFKPTQTTEQVTLAVAADIAQIAMRLNRDHEPHHVAHFLMKCMFCLFAQWVPGLLPNKLFKKLLSQHQNDPTRFTKLADELFQKMATGGNFGIEEIPYFNGGLFDDAPPIKLGSDDLGVLSIAADRDWSQIEPSILGTLFERSLDPSKRAQIGAHYTSKEDILLVINPVIINPLRQKWLKLKAEIESELTTPTGTATVKERPPTPPSPGTLPAQAASKQAGRTRSVSAGPLTPIHEKIAHFLANLSSLKILDPACGSGNFLYVAIQQLLSLEKEVITFAAQPPISLRLLPRIRPTQLLGIEINPYAAELAQVSIWIGFLQWLHLNGFPAATDSPILSKIQTIEENDAILLRKRNKDGTFTPLPIAAKWPAAHFIIGNPPFLGSKVFRSNGLPDDYISALYKAYDLPKTSDLCCYWFEIARRRIEAHAVPGHAFPDIAFPRAGLLATQGIRGGDNRTVLERIKKSGDIFMAWSDKEWVLDGATVHTSIIGFDSGTDRNRMVDGFPTDEIHSDLSTGLNLTGISTLAEMTDLSFQGPVKVGHFELDVKTVRDLLAKPNGPRGHISLEVLKPWRNGESLNERYHGEWIVDFALMPLSEAALFEAPFEYVRKHVKPERDKNKREGRRLKWWLWGEPNPNMRNLLRPLRRFIATCQTAKHRIWMWLPTYEIPAQTIIGIGRDDDYLLGVLHSSFHELWSREIGTQLREAESGQRYTPTKCFETFPLPWPPGKEKTKHAAYKRIAAAAKELNDLRERWLNPPELLKPLAQILDANDKFLDVPAEARPLIRHSALMAKAAESPQLKKRTLTNLYNERPTWLKLAHEKLDSAVLAAYAAIDPAGDWSEDWAALYTQTGAGQPLHPNHPQSADRAATDQKILANLLRLNHQRATANQQG